MKKATLENQLQKLYQKAELKKQQIAQHPDLGHSESANRFGDTLKHSIQRMNDISHEVDTALESLSQAQTEEKEINAEIAQADAIHQRIMQEQHNLAKLYNKLKLRKEP